MQSKERPMLYSTDMVVSILEDRKTKTRRMAGLETINTSPDSVTFIRELHPNYKQKDQPVFRFKSKPESLASEYIDVQCPYGKTGDILWVRETWTRIAEDSITVFKADYKGQPVAWNWKPSIHMPKVAARIWLQITDIKVERLQQITEEDALAEGIIECEDGTYYNYFTQKGLRYRDGVECLLAKGSFQSLWCSINGLDSWAHNPWVWVISFKVLSKTGKPSTMPSGFQTPLSCNNESLKSSPSGTMQKQVEEAHLLPGNGDVRHGFCVNPNSTCTMNYCDDNGCVERKRTSTGKEVSNA